MKADTPPEATKPAGAEKHRRFPRLWKWLKRGLWTFLVLVVLLLIFHRPLLRFALDRGAKYVAKGQGMDLSWEVGGTVVNGIDLKDIRIAPNEAALVRSLTAQRLATDYSLMELIREGPGRFVRKLILTRADVVLDRSKIPPPKPQTEKKEPPPPPAVDIPEVQLTDVNLRMIEPGGDLVVRGLNFTLNPGGSGVFEFERLEVPGMPVLENVKGTTLVEGHRVTIQMLNVMPDLMVKSLSVDLKDLPDRRLSAKMELEVPGGTITTTRTAGGGQSRAVEGKGNIAFEGTLDGIGRELSVKGVARLTSLLPSTLSPWVKLPPDLTWQVQEIDATFDGPVNDPKKFQASVEVKARDIVTGGVKLDKAEIGATLEKSQVMVKTRDVSFGKNRLVATITGQMPYAWANAGKMPLQAKAEVDFPQVAELFTKDPPLTGSLSGKLSAGLNQGQLSEAGADLTGSNWVIQGIPVEKVEVKANTDGNMLRLTSLLAALDTTNVIEASGTLGFTGARPLNAEWKATLPNAERLAGFSGRKDLPGPEAGRLAAGGKISGNLADWQKQDFSKTLAELKLDGTGIAWKTGRVESLGLAATLAEGRVEVPSLSVVLNDRNRVTLSGGGELKAPYAFRAKVDGDLNQLQDFNGWMQALGAGKLLAGKATLRWEGSGRAAENDVVGGGAVKVDGFRMEGMKDPVSLSLKSTHAGRRLEMTELAGSTGDYRISAPFTVDEHFLEIPMLRVAAGKLPPVEGRLKVPLDFAQKGGPAGPVASSGDVDIRLSIRDWDLAEAARTARQKPAAKGKVNAEVTITGSILNPSADISLKLQGVSVPDIKQKIVPADAVVKLTLKDRKLDLTVDVTQKPLQTLHATAKVPLDVQKVLKDPASLQALPLDVTVNLPDSDLNVLRQFVPAISSVKGRVGMTARITGTPARPNITGNLRANAPAISFVQDDVPDAKNVRLNVRFDGKRVYIEEAGALLAGGNVSARGAIDWTDIANPRIDATLTAKEALILRDDTISMRADGNVTVRGSLSQASVTGRVELVRGRVFKEIEFLPLSLPNQLPPAPPAVTVGKKSAPSLPPPFDKWTLGIEIITRDPVRLLGNVLNGGVTSALRVTGTGANPVLEGKATLVDARVRLPFSRMTISRGDVIFTKDKPFDPQLDVQGDSFINNYQVTLNAYGPALNPKLRFSSSPPLSEGEIATLLATGSTSGDLRSSQGEAANRAAFLVLSQAYRKLFHKAGRTPLDEEPPRLSLSFSLLNNGGGTRSVSAVYELNKNLQAVGSFNQTGSFRGLLYYLIRFR